VFRVKINRYTKSAKLLIPKEGIKEFTISTSPFGGFRGIPLSGEAWGEKKI
jgi:hypothetical protein